MSSERETKRARVETSKDGDLIMCIQCNKKPGTIECRRDVEKSCRQRHKEPYQKIKWCKSCAESNKGLYCPVCKTYQCPKCDKKNDKLAKPPIDMEEAMRILRGDVAMISNDVNGDNTSDDSSIASSNSWHPEGDANLYKKQCQHCDMMICRLFDSSCYKSCVACNRCPATSALGHWKRNGFVAQSQWRLLQWRRCLYRWIFWVLLL